MSRRSRRTARAFNRLRRDYRWALSRAARSVPFPMPEGMWRAFAKRQGARMRRGLLDARSLRPSPAVDIKHKDILALESAIENTFVERR